jgi:hypothetical protein
MNINIERFIDTVNLNISLSIMHKYKQVKTGNKYVLGNAHKKLLIFKNNTQDWTGEPTKATN